MKSLGLKSLFIALASILLVSWSGSSAAQNAPSYWMACKNWLFIDFSSDDLNLQQEEYRYKSFEPAPLAATKENPFVGNGQPTQCAWFDRPVNPAEAKLKFYLGPKAQREHTRQQLKDLHYGNVGFLYLLVHAEGQQRFHIDDWSVMWLPKDAQRESFYMACRGGSGMRTIEYGYFRAVSVAPASSSANKAAPAPGQCAWLDRPLNVAETRLPLFSSHAKTANELSDAIRSGQPFYMLVSRGSLPSGIPGTQALWLRSAPTFTKPQMPNNVTVQPGVGPAVPTNAPANGRVILQPGAVPGALDANSSGKNRKIYWGN
jgi:hypothetical protein